MEKDLEFDPHPDYIEGYNQAYVLMQEYRELADQIAKSMSQSERCMGFKDGREQYIAEKSVRLPKWLQNKDEIERGIEPEKGKDEYERSR